jgi:hypothetical protein
MEVSMRFIKSVLFLTFISSLSLGHASIALELEAQIHTSTTESGPAKIYLMGENEDIEITNSPDEFMGCIEGRFIVIENMINPETYSVVEFLSCSKFKDQIDQSFEVVQHSYSCPKIFEPVCGSFENELCLEGDCSNLLQTYGNKCELIHSGGNFLHEGFCE